MRKALLADDDFLVRSYLKMLSSWEKAGFEITADVRDGEEALEVLDREKIDLVVTDIAGIPQYLQAQDSQDPEA